MRVASHLSWPGWERFLLVVCAGAHLLLGGALLFAPDEQVINAGTRAVFELAPRWGWGIACLIAGLAAASLLHRITVVRQMVTWLTVIPLGFAWFAAFVLPLLITGRGSAIGAVIFPTVYLIFGAVAVRIGLRRR